LAEAASAVIVGGGVVGCALAYYLAKLGMKDVVLIEKSYLASGSTGRCGAGIRLQWGTEMNCRLARASMDKFERMNEELGYDGDLELKQGGYLILAYTEAELEQFKRNVELQRSLGIESEVLAPDRAREIVPHLRTDGLVGATFCARDGHLNPFRVVEAYALAAKRLGVSIRTYTEVTGIDVRDGRVYGVETTAGRIDTPIVVNAAGPWSKPVAAMAGVDLPVYSERHQILVSEPVEPLQRPMVISFYYGVYCQQVPNGNFIMGLGDPNEPKGFDIGHSWQFLERVAGIVTRMMPVLGGLRVIRQWSGLYNITPDAQPVLGEAPGVEGYYMAVGFSGHGFMVAPAVAEGLARKIHGMEPGVPIERLDLGRFERGELVKEPSAV